MACRYTAEEACEPVMNDDDFGEMESADCLDDSCSNTSSSMPEIGSNPEDVFLEETLLLRLLHKGVDLVQGT